MENNTPKRVHKIDPTIYKECMLIKTETNKFLRDIYKEYAVHGIGFVEFSTAKVTFVNIGEVTPTKSLLLQYGDYLEKNISKLKSEILEKKHMAEPSNKFPTKKLFPELIRFGIASRMTQKELAEKIKLLEKSNEKHAIRFVQVMKTVLAEKKGRN